MDNTFYEYADLDHKELNRVLKGYGELNIVLNGRRARALQKLLKSFTDITLMNKANLNFLQSLWLGIKSFFITFWVLVIHNRLMQVFGVVSVKKVTINWSETTNGNWEMSVKQMKFNKELNSTPKSGVI